MGPKTQQSQTDAIRSVRLTKVIELQQDLIALFQTAV